MYNDDPIIELTRIVLQSLFHYPQSLHPTTWPNLVSRVKELNDAIRNVVTDCEHDIGMESITLTGAYEGSSFQRLYQLFRDRRFLFGMIECLLWAPVSRNDPHVCVRGINRKWVATLRSLDIPETKTLPVLPQVIESLTETFLPVSPFCLDSPLQQREKSDFVRYVVTPLQKSVFLLLHNGVLGFRCSTLLTNTLEETQTFIDENAKGNTPLDTVQFVTLMALCETLQVENHPSIPNVGAFLRLLMKLRPLHEALFTTSLRLNKVDGDNSSFSDESTSRDYDKSRSTVVLSTSPSLYFEDLTLSESLMRTNNNSEWHLGNDIPRQSDRRLFFEVIEVEESLKETLLGMLLQATTSAGACHVTEAWQSLMALFTTNKVNIALLLLEHFEEFVKSVVRLLALPETERVVVLVTDSSNNNNKSNSTVLPPCATSWYVRARRMLKLLAHALGDPVYGKARTRLADSPAILGQVLRVVGTLKEPSRTTAQQRMHRRDSETLDTVTAAVVDEMNNGPTMDVLLHYECYHVLKVFIAKPKKTLTIRYLLSTNRDALLKFLTDYDELRDKYAMRQVDDDNALRKQEVQILRERLCDVELLSKEEQLQLTHFIAIKRNNNN